MPVKIPDTLPATSILESENIFVMAERLATTLKGEGYSTDVLLAALAKAGMRLTIEDDARKEKAHGR